VRVQGTATLEGSVLFSPQARPCLQAARPLCEWPRRCPSAQAAALPGRSGDASSRLTGPTPKVEIHESFSPRDICFYADSPHINFLFPKISKSLFFSIDPPPHNPPITLLRKALPWLGLKLAVHRKRGRNCSFSGIFPSPFFHRRVSSTFLI